MRVLRNDDIIGVMKVILDLKDGKGDVDDIVDRAQQVEGRETGQVETVVEDQSGLETAVGEKDAAVDLRQSVSVDAHVVCSLSVGSGRKRPLAGAEHGGGHDNHPENPWYGCN